MKIKEGGGMDIQKELLAYEQSLQDNGFFKVENIGMCTVFDPEQNKYHPSDLCDPKEHKFIDMLNIGWTAWQAAKANAVPEGYKLVPIDSVAVNKKEIPAIREALHIMNFKHGDVRGDFASADAAIEKAIEATQEPAND